MATIKSYTDIEQSKKLAEILPLESSDMYYFIADNLEKQETNYAIRCGTPIVKTDIPCWSLAALLDILPIIEKGKDIFNPFIAKTPDNGYYIVYATLTKEGNSSAIYDNPVDACYEMILKLHELNLL